LSENIPFYLPKSGITTQQKPQALTKAASRNQCQVASVQALAYRSWQPMKALMMLQLQVQLPQLGQNNVIPQRFFIA